MRAAREPSGAADPSPLQVRFDVAFQFGGDLESGMAKEVDVRVVFYKDANTWVAQCIEYDIAAFAETLKDLPRAIERAIAANSRRSAQVR